MNYLTDWQKALLFSYLDTVSEFCEDFPDGAWLAFMTEAVNVWCDGMTESGGLGNLMQVDEHEAVIVWLQNVKGIGSDTTIW
jgi:hypothetical protein